MPRRFAYKNSIIKAFQWGIVDAFQYGVERIPPWFAGMYLPVGVEGQTNPKGDLYLDTPEGRVFIQETDWIIFGPDGQYVRSNEVFREEFTEVYKEYNRYKLL